MALSDTGAREIAKVLRKHVAPKTLEEIAAELVEIRGDKNSATQSKASCRRCGRLLAGELPRADWVTRSCASRLSGTLLHATSPLR